MRNRPTVVALLAALAAGCTPTKPIEPPKPQYSDLGPKDVAGFLRNTVWQFVDLGNTTPLRVSGYGLVVNLDGTGDTRAPTAVRDFMLSQMQKHGFGSSAAGLRNLDAERVLNDPNHRTAIVRVDGYIAAGARQGQMFDARVSALENSNTTSLNRGILYETDLSPRGADPFSLSSSMINPWARVKSGQVVINPALAVSDEAPSGVDKLAVRSGLVMNRGVVAEDRPLILKLRQPERRLARRIEAALNERFQEANNERFTGSKTANAKDEGEIWLYVPLSYGQDWERFAGVALHTDFNPNADYAAQQARNLADIARKDGDQAPLRNISYCWEALGHPAVDALSELYLSPVPAVAYAAARAGAYGGDFAAQEALMRIARTAANPFRLDAVRVLGSLRPTAMLRTSLRALLDDAEPQVRVAAYQAMIANGDPLILSTELRGGFLLDIVPSDAPPLVFATRTGTARIAVLGKPARLVSPSLMMALDKRLTIMSDDQHTDGARLFFRGSDYYPPVTQEAKADLPVLIGRLGGETPDPKERFLFNYADVVGIIKRLCDEKSVAAVGPGGQRQPVTFLMESVIGLDDLGTDAPRIDQRPQDTPGTQPSDGPLTINSTPQ